MNLYCVAAQKKKIKRDGDRKETQYRDQRSRKIIKCMVSHKPKEQNVSERQVETTVSKSTKRLRKIRTANDH